MNKTIKRQNVFTLDYISRLWSLFKNISILHANNQTQKRVFKGSILKKTQSTFNIITLKQLKVKNVNFLKVPKWVVEKSKT